MVTTFCLDCEHEIEINANYTVGDKIKCFNCGVKLEIINLDPLELDWVYERATIDFDSYGNELLWTLPFFEKFA